MVWLISIVTYAAAVSAAAVYGRQNTCTPGPVTINGRLGTIECDKDHAGGDYSNQAADTLDACAKLCGADTTCLTAQHDAGAKRCYLKSIVNPVVSKPGINGIVFGVTSSTTTASLSTTTKASTTGPPASTTSVTTTTTAGACRPSTTAARYDTFLGRTAAVQIHRDYAGSDYLQQYTGCESRCADLCAADLKCVVAMYAFENGYCYLKSVLNTPPVLGKAVISFVFYNETSLAAPSANCAKKAPPNPWIIDGGYEYGKFYSNYQTSSFPTSGTFSSSIVTGNAFEGCAALFTYPTSDNNNYRDLSFGVQYEYVEIGKTYEVSFVIGRPINYLTSQTDRAPNLNVYAENRQIYTGTVCGWVDSGPCPIAATGGGSGALIKAQFPVTAGYFNDLTFEISWSAPSNDAILLDDIRLNLASSGPVTSTTTTLISTTTKASTTTAVTTTPATTTIKTTTSAATTPVTTTSSAPVSNPTACTAQYTTIAGRTAAIQCGVDHPGGDLGSSGASSLDACAKICANNAQCQTAQYVPGSQTCYLKKTVYSPKHAANVNSIVFYTATSPNSCPNSAPPSPYLLNGGYEEGFLDYEVGAYGSAGSFNSKVITGTVFEGCKALQVVPTSDASQQRYVSFGTDYQGLTIGQRYNLTLTVGRPTSAISPNKAPRFEAIFQDGIYYSAEICGWSNTGPCPIQGQGGAVGQVGVPQFTATAASGVLYYRITWNDAANEVVLLDDVRIQTY